MEPGCTSIRVFKNSFLGEGCGLYSNIDTCLTISYFCALQGVFSTLGFENNTIIIQNITVLEYLDIYLKVIGNGTFCFVQIACTYSCSITRVRRN